MIYRALFRVFLRRINPEWAHELAFWLIRMAGLPGVWRLARATTAYRGAPTWTAGLEFSGPFGLAAGFDKNARAITGLAALGFGHIEVGTVTPLAQPGNSRPRLFRLTMDRALINRMGFNNDGAERVAARLGRLRRRHRSGDLPVIGVNLGKNKDTPADQALQDYERAAHLLAPFADYLVVNVSSPNTPGLRDLQATSQLAPIIAAVTRQTLGKPVFVKIAPDLADADLRQVAGLVQRLGIAGVIACNTTLARTGLTSPQRLVEIAGPGGLSGPPLADRSLAVLRLLRELLPEATLISVGGVESASDVRQRLDAGANLVQGYTGFVYHGPLWARAINRDLSAA